MNSTRYSLLLLILMSCHPRMNSNKEFKKIRLSDEVTVVVPVAEKEFNDSLNYVHVEIWIENEQVFRDSSPTEYFFNRNFPAARKLKTGAYEVLMPVFDSPDFDKLSALYFQNGQLIKKDTLPLFKAEPKDVDQDGKKEYWGILHKVEPYRGKDSCYYNPILFYEEGDNGTVLDSALTREKIKSFWGGFYGYRQSKAIILPCYK